MIFNDCETYCEVDIGVAGVSRYAEDDSLELKCWSFAFDDDEPLIWIPGNPPPNNLFDRIESGEPMRSFNAWFEMQIWRHYCVKRLGWPVIPDSQWQDTQADALAFGLPAKLEECAVAINSRYQKDKHGHRVMLKICRPCKPSKDHPYTKWEKTDSLQDHLDLYKYCMQDVRTERGIYKFLPYHVTDPTHQERKIWEMTVRSNRRGVPIDVVSVYAIQAKIEEKVARLQEEFSSLMGDCKLKISQRDAIRAHLNERYLNGQLPNMQGQTIIDLLKNKKVFIPDTARAILRIYLLSNYASIKKFKRIISQICKDGAVKDNIRYHGAATGRDTAQGFQLQNLTRSFIEEEEFALTMIRENTLEQVEFVFGNMLFLASCLCRAIIMAPQGYKHMNADLSQIEARMRAWIALEEDYLQNFRDGLCPYKTAAARMFNVLYEDIKKSDSIRQAGKVGDLACLDGNLSVLTDKGLVPLEQVCTCMRVWDGVEWVNHDGTIYKGIKEVMFYDELLGTPEHKVYISEKESVELREAARLKQRIAQTGLSGKEIRLGENNTSLCRGVEWLSDGSLQMPKLPKGEMDKSRESSRWEDWRLSEVQPTKNNSPLVIEKVPRREVALRKQRPPGVQELRWPGNRISIQYGCRSGALGRREYRFREIKRVRSNSKQRALRERKFTVGWKGFEQFKQKKFHHSGISSFSTKIPTCSFCGQHLTEFHKAKKDRLLDSRTLEVTKPQTKRKVWDILNAGPRSRFTINGRLVGNCGYQGGEKAFKKMGAKHGLAVSDKDAKLWTNLFRMAHPKLVATWKAFGVAAKDAILKPGTIQNVETNPLFSFLFKEEMLYMHLPNSRLLVFPFARYEKWMMPWGEEAMSVTHMWCNNEKGNRWERRGISGASLMQSADQGLSRDVLMESALRVEALGYPTIFRVHDEVDCLVPDDARFNLEVFKREFEKVPEWCADLPLTSDVWEGTRYKK